MARYDHTINNDTNSVAAVWFTLLGGKFRVRLTDDRGPGHRSGDVLDDKGAVIGNAYDFTYCGRAFVVQTRPFAGCVPLDQIEFVD